MERKNDHTAAKGRWMIGLFLLLLICAGWTAVSWLITSGKVSVMKKWQASLPEEDIKPEIALTFDDGPHPDHTPLLLDGLRKRDICATFFVVGENVEKYQEIIRRMHREGHMIGNHTYGHVDLMKLSGKEACLEITKANALIEDLTGKEVQYIRPPFGNWRESLECEIGMIPVMWDVDSNDWRTEDVEVIVNKVVTNVEEGDIILLHDYYESSVAAALQIVDALTLEGYEFVTVEELILE